MCPKSLEPITTPRERRTKSPEQALQSLMRLCSRAERSSGDALRLMHTWGVEESARRGVLRRLIDDRYIDDRRYAEAYTREKSQLSGWGTRKIALHLKQKGIAQPIIDDVLATLDSAQCSEQLARKLRRKLPSVRSKSVYELRQKLLRYALSLGFDGDACFSAVDALLSQRE